MKLGIIGPKDLVDKSIGVGKKYEEINVIATPYTNEENIESSIRKIEDEVDAFLFTGFLPYYYVKYNELTRKDIYYYPILGSALYRTLLAMKNNYDIDLSQISIDTLKEKQIIDVYEDLGMDTKNLFINDTHLSNYKNQDYVNFHYDLYNSDRTKGAITSINSVYMELIKLGVPTLKIEPTKYTMKNIFRMISLDNKTQIAKKNQILIIMIDIAEYSLNREKLSNIEKQSKRLQLHQELLDYSRIHQASVFSSADSEEFIILITKGIFSEYTNDYENIPIVNEIKAKFSIEINVGIGMGVNALEAEENARKALELSRSNKESDGFLINQDKHVVGPIGSINKLEYVLKTENKELLDCAEKTGVSISTITRIESIMKNLQTNSITAKDIEVGLDITLRSANRIMKKLVEGEVATEVGLEQIGGRGRPRKVYEIKWI